MGPRFLCLLPSLTAWGGGIELYLRQLLGALLAARPEAELVAVLAKEAHLARPEQLAPALRERLVVAGCADGPRARRIGAFLARAGREASRRRPDVVLCGHLNYAAAGLTLARAARARLWVVAHGIEAWNLGGGLSRHALRRADRVIAVSAYTAAQLVRAVGLRPEQLVVLNNAVDTRRFRPGAPSPAFEAKLAGQRRPRLLSVCRLDAGERYKGVDTVLRLLARHPTIAGAYLVSGDGTDRARLESLARELAVPATFLGRVPDEELVDLYRASDVFVMPSWSEGFGFVFIEALACGLPVVAGSVDGSVDALAGGQLGLLVDPFAIDQIAAAVSAHLSGTSPAPMRDPAHLHAEVTRRFGEAAFAARVAALVAG